MWVPVVAEGVVAAILTILVYRQFASFTRHPWWVPFFGIPGFFLAFSMAFLLPIDVSSSMYDRCVLNAENPSSCEEPWSYLSDRTLIIMWRVIYWTSYGMCWTVYPFFVTYSLTGGFSFFERARRAMMENIIMYSTAGIILLVILIYISAANHVEGAGIAGIAIAAANAWGLLLCVLFMGFGLVEIPRQLLLRSTHSGLMNSYRGKIVERHDELQAAEREIDTTLKLVKKISDEIPKDDPWRPYIDKIISECPPQYEDIDYGDGDMDASYETLVKLSKMVKTSKTSVHRCQALYTELLHTSLELEDIIETGKQGCGGWKIKWAHPRRPTHRVLMWLKFPFLEWLWRVWLEVWMYRFLTIISTLMSLSLLWCEVTMPSYLDPDPNVKNSEGVGIDLSIWSRLIHIHNLGDLTRQILVIIPICYLAICVYWSLFRFRLFNFYRLIPHQQTDPGSLLFAALYLGRLTSPLAYNFLNVIHNRSTAFFELMGDMAVVPIIGTSLNTYLPAALVIVSVATLFNLFSRISNLCYLRKFDFSGSASASQREEGDKLLRKEREQLERHQQLGTISVHDTPVFYDSQPRRNVIELMDMDTKSRTKVEDKGKTIVRDKPGERERVYLSNFNARRGLDKEDSSTPARPSIASRIASGSLSSETGSGERYSRLSTSAVTSPDLGRATGVLSRPTTGRGRHTDEEFGLDGGTSVSSSTTSGNLRLSGGSPGPTTTPSGGASGAASGGALTSRLFGIFGSSRANTSTDTSLSDFVDDIEGAAARVHRTRSTLNSQW